MCMKNLNITTLTFRKLNNSISSMQVFDTVVPEVVSNEVVLKDFNVLINTSVIIPRDPSVEDSLTTVLQGETYEVLIRMNHLHSNSGFVLDKYEFTLGEDNIKNICRQIYETRKVVSIPDLHLESGIGRYAIKVFVKNKKDDKWFVQSIQTLRVVFET